jgi:hypothetical protein
MSFKSIGELCRDVIAEAELAARGHNGGHKLKSGGRSAGRGSDQPPTLYADAPAPSGSSEVDGKHGDAARPVGSTKPNVLSGQFQPSPARGRPVLAVIQGSRGRAIASANNMGRPRPIAVARPLLSVIEGGHATGPR